MTVTTPNPIVKPAVPTWVWVGVVTAMGGGFLAYYERRKAVPATPTTGDVPPDKTVDEVPAYSDGGYGIGGGGEIAAPTQTSTTLPPNPVPPPIEAPIAVDLQPEPQGDPNYDGMGFYIGPKDTGGGPPDSQPQMIDGWSVADHDAIITYIATHPTGRQTTKTTTKHGYR